MYSLQSACLEQSDILKSVLNNKKNLKLKVNNSTTANDATNSNSTKNKLLIIRKQLNKIDQDLNVYNQKYLNSVVCITFFLSFFTKWSLLLTERQIRLSSEKIELCLYSNSDKG